MDVNSTPEMEDLVLEEPSKEETHEQPFLVHDMVKHATSTKEAIISLHVLLGGSTPQTLKIKGYIKYHQLVVLIDKGNTHKFIHRAKAKALHIFIHPVKKL